MSEYCVIKVDINDTDSLKEALKELGYPFEEHSESQNLRGYRGDTREQRAHLIVRKEYISSMSNDIGFLRGTDGKYKLIISQYDKSVPRIYNDFAKKAQQLYSKSKILKQTAKLGFTPIKTSTDEQGRIKIVVRSYA